MTQSTNANGADPDFLSVSASRSNWLSRHTLIMPGISEDFDQYESNPAVARLAESLID